MFDHHPLLQLKTLAPYKGRIFLTLLFARKLSNQCCHGKRGETDSSSLLRVYPLSKKFCYTGDAMLNLEMLHIDGAHRFKFRPFKKRFARAQRLISNTLQSL